jgi:hypothetical protein
VVLIQNVVFGAIVACWLPSTAIELSLTLILVMYTSGPAKENDVAKKKQIQTIEM